MCPQHAFVLLAAILLLQATPSHGETKLATFLKVGTATTFTASNAAVTFDASTGTLTYGDKTMTGVRVTTVGTIFDTVAVEGLPENKPRTGPVFKFEGTSNNEPAQVVVAQVFDESIETDAPSLESVANTVDAYATDAARTGPEKLAFDAAKHLVTALASTTGFKNVNVYKDGDAFKLTVNFDLATAGAVANLRTAVQTALGQSGGGGSDSGGGKTTTETSNGGTTDNGGTTTTTSTPPKDGTTTTNTPPAESSGNGGTTTTTTKFRRAGRRAPDGTSTTTDPTPATGDGTTTTTTENGGSTTPTTSGGTTDTPQDPSTKPSGGGSTPTPPAATNFASVQFGIGLLGKLNDWTTPDVAPSANDLSQPPAASSNGGTTDNGGSSPTPSKDGTSTSTDNSASPQSPSTGTKPPSADGGTTTATPPPSTTDSTPTQLEIDEDSVLVAGRRHHHHKKHSTPFSRVHRFSRSASQSQSKWMLQKLGVGKPALVGGASISPDGGGWGTMGGILIAQAPGQTSSPATDDILLGMTNAHVISGATRVCQPAMFTGGTCELVGAEKGTSCCTGPSHTQDVGAFTIDYTRTNVRCEILDNMPTPYTSTSLASTLAVSGFATAATGDAVIKYGARTHKTAGTNQVIVGASFGLEMRIRGAGFPSFVEQPTVPPVTPSTGGPAQANPLNENNFLGTFIKNDWISTFCIFATPDGSTTVFTATQCGTIWDQLWAATPNHIVDVFHTHGDSGSFVTRNTQVVGLIANEDWQETDPRDLTILGRAWGYMHKDGLAYSFPTALASVNTILRAAGIPGGATLCTESLRTKPVPPDCSTALNDDHTSCKWPRQCALGGSSSSNAQCAPRSAFGM